MHEEEQSQASILQIERKQCSRKSLVVLIQKSKTSPIVTQKKIWKGIPPLPLCPNPPSYTNS
jgi:hypothetical protein